MRRGRQRTVSSIFMTLLVLVSTSWVFTSWTLALGQTGTIDRPDAGFGSIDTSAPSEPPEKIIQEFAAKESQFKQALDNYTYQRDVRVQTVNDDGKVDGEYRQVVQISFDDAPGAKWRR